MKSKGRPYLIILDEDLEIAVTFLTEKDLRRQINMSYDLLLRVYFKLNGLSNKNVWKYVSQNRQDLIDKMLPFWPSKKYPINPPKCNIIEFKYVKLCLNHFNYVSKYSLCLCNEFVKRYNKKHPKDSVLYWINENPPKLPFINGYECKYPIRSIPIYYRRKTYIESARTLYKSLVQDPMNEYNKVSVPEFFNLKDIY